MTRSRVLEKWLNNLLESVSGDHLTTDSEYLTMGRLFGHFVTHGVDLTLGDAVLFRGSRVPTTLLNVALFDGHLLEHVYLGDRFDHGTRIADNLDYDSLHVSVEDLLDFLLRVMIEH